MRITMGPHALPSERLLLLMTARLVQSGRGGLTVPLYPFHLTICPKTFR
jgi:hypothetical protein